jgi:hypothetical protein
LIREEFLRTGTGVIEHKHNGALSPRSGKDADTILESRIPLR